MYTSIIYDVDGTLIDTERAVLGSLQKMLNTDYGMAMEKRDLTFVLGIPGAVALPQLGIQNVEEANDRWNEYMKEFYSTVSVFDGISQVLQTLKRRKLKQGIVTSKTGEELKDDFMPFGLMEYLTYKVIAENTEKHKPHPEPLLKYLEISGSDPQSSIYIGDTIYDFECARDAGVDFALALWGCKNHEIIPARYKLSRPEELLELLQL
ncbi:HAD superfamily hydrolase (TIGR01549 family) [Fontibacillus phaseoli]|uniref:HAD superfamily hydrolase (TIGR01549 family) n=1 Tax=Fontibacillus phaseoli TaxID=1416533 RepID=A0A369BGF7_9BACL|nr:HAD family hydrolase [Fontibacillus phaseoli]RCX20633.1 HAD superfamily hydrolase (TIGR01549 family) [Fontibacillus phaseoli]